MNKGQGLIFVLSFVINVSCCYERVPKNKNINADPFKVWTACWWMAHYMSKFPKRHIAWSNSPTVGKLDLGTLCRSVMKMLAKSGKRSATTYESRGRKRFVGSKFLRSTQSLSQFYHLHALCLKLLKSRQHTLNHYSKHDDSLECHQRLSQGPTLLDLDFDSSVYMTLSAETG